MLIQISWLHQKPADLDQHCFQPINLYKQSFCTTEMTVNQKLSTTEMTVNQKLIFCLFDLIMSSQQFFSYFGTGLPGLNQY